MDHQRRPADAAWRSWSDAASVCVLVLCPVATSEGRKRRVFRITGAGSKALHAWLGEPSFSFELRDEGLLKLFFADLLPQQQALQLIRDRREVHERILARLREIRPGPGPIGGSAEYPDVVLDYGIRWMEWAIGWCDETERRLARKRTKRA